MKRLGSKAFVIVTIFVLLSMLLPLAAGAVQVGTRTISSQAAVVIDYETGLVIFEHNANTQRVPASLAKMVAVHVVYDAIRDGKVTLNTRVQYSNNVSDFSYNRIYSNVPMPRGSSYTVRELLDAIIVRSACAATIALGAAVFGSEAATVALMNAKAKQLGVSATFIDCWGGSPDNKISALGIAEMTRALIMEYPEVLAITAKRSIRFDGVTYNATNPLLGEYTGLDGFKTGFTTPAGYCFIGTAKRTERRMIAVTLGSTQALRFTDIRILLDYGFANVDRVIAENQEPEEPKEPDEPEIPVIPEDPRDKVAPSNSNVVVDGVLVPVSAYNVGGSHYFKLRDLAMLLNWTNKRFEVWWNAEDRIVSMISRRAYTPVGGELVIAENIPVPYDKTTLEIHVDGVVMKFDSILINSNNHIKVRDIAQVLDFFIDWEGATRTITINTSVRYDHPLPAAA